MIHDGASAEQTTIRRELPTNAIIRIQTLQDTRFYDVLRKILGRLTLQCSPEVMKKVRDRSPKMSGFCLTPVSLVPSMKLAFSRFRLPV